MLVYEITAHLGVKERDFSQADGRECIEVWSTCRQQWASTSELASLHHNT